MKRSLFANLLSILSRFPGQFISVILLTTLGALIEGVGITVFYPLLDAGDHVSQPFFLALLKGDGSQHILVRVGICLFIIAIVRCIVLFLRNYGQKLLAVRVEKRLRGEAYDRYLTLCVSEIDKLDSSTFVNLICIFPTSASLCVDQVVIAFSGAFTCLVYLIMLVVISWRLTLIGVSLMLGSLATIHFLFTPMAQSRGKLKNLNELALHRWVMETVRSTSFFQSLALAKQMQDEYKPALEEYEHACKSQARVISLSDPILGTVILCIMGLLLILFGSLPDGSGNEIGQALMMLIVFTRCAPWVSIINQVKNTIDTLAHRIEMLCDYINRSDYRRLPSGSKEVKTMSAEISFSDVTFTYPGAEKPSLSGFSCIIKRNSLVALVGTSGSGKSTLAALLMRLYDPQEGSISIGDQDLKVISRDSWCSKIAYVPETPGFIDGSVLKNLRLGAPEASESACREACIAANAWEFIERLPYGLHTSIGDNGVRISTGQKQRLAIARALVRKPSLLILDEATSNLDSFSEQKIQNSIAALRGNLTIVVIAHRLATVRDADLIMLLSEGKKLRAGTHAELVEADSLYREMVELQTV